MNTRLFSELIEYVADKEESSYVDIWGKRVLSRFRGKSKTFAKISTAEAVATKRDYRVIKSRISEDENLDDLLLMCERGVKKYDETGSFFKWFRIIIIGFGLILVQSVGFSGSMEIERINKVSRASACVVGSEYEECNKLKKDILEREVSDITFNIKVFGFIFLLVATVTGLISIAIISNDNKGRVHLDILSFYVNRLKKDREIKDNK